VDSTTANVSLQDFRCILLSKSVPFWKDLEELKHIIRSLKRTPLRG